MRILSKKQELFERRWLYIVSLYLIIDLARPQSIIPIAFLRPGLVTIVLLVCFLYFSGKARHFIKKQISLIFYFISLLAIFVLLASNNFWAYHAFKTMCLMIPFILSIPILINSRDRLIFLTWVFAFIVAFLSAYGLMHSGRGPGGIVSDENDLCLFLVTFLPFVFFLLSQNQQTFKKYILLGIVILAILASVSTFSRGGFVGLVTMGAVYWWFNKNKILILFCAVILVIVASLYGGESYRQDMSTVTDRNESTANVRLLSWEAGWGMFLDHPLGVGGNNFPVYFPDYQPSALSHNMWGRQAHSLWFTLIPETGIIGILIYFLIIKFNLKDLKFIRRVHILGRREDSDNFYLSISIALIASFAGFFASASFLSVLYYPEFWYLTTIVIATKNLAKKNFEQSPIVQDKRSYTK